MSIASLLQETTTKFSGYSDTPSLDAQVLLADLLGVERAWLLAHREELVSGSDRDHFRRLADRIVMGTPLPYILGHWEFFGLTFDITPDVLIPRPETELLVEHALNWLGNHTSAQRVADIGTGSGCIAVSIAVRQPRVWVTAVDETAEALQVARTNTRKHSVDQRVSLIQSDLLTGIHSRFDLVCANLPYIPFDELKRLAVFGKEPLGALDGGPDGWQTIERCLQMLPANLAKNGLALFEIEASQGKMAVESARKYFPRADVQIIQDLAGKDRLLKIDTWI